MNLSIASIWNNKISLEIAYAEEKLVLVKAGGFESLQLFQLKTDVPFVRIFAELNRGDTHQGRLM